MFSLFLALLLLAAPAESPDQAAVRKAEAGFCKAVADRDRAAFASYMADEVMTFPGGVASRGKNVFLKSWESFFAEDGPRITWAPTTIEVSKSGDLAYSTGGYATRWKDAEGNDVTSIGHFVSVWKRQPDGRWKVVLEIGTPTQQPAASPEKKR